MWMLFLRKQRGNHYYPSTTGGALDSGFRFAAPE
jgi:hypothetical protein